MPSKSHTLTYFIPAPPHRKTGYREKAFDSLVYKLTELGFRIDDINAQVLSPNDPQVGAGMWVILKITPLTKDALKYNPKNFPEDFLTGQTEDKEIVSTSEIELTKDVTAMDSDVIEGLYQIE